MSLRIDEYYLMWLILDFVAFTNFQETVELTYCFLRLTLLKLMRHIYAPHITILTLYFIPHQLHNRHSTSQCFSNNDLHIALVRATEQPQ